MPTIARKPFQLGALSVHFAALSFDQLDQLQTEIALLVQPGGANFARVDSRAAIVAVTTASLEHAGITADDVRKNLNVANFPDVIGHLFDRNGFLEPAAGEGEGDGTGEAKAAASVS